MNEITKLLPFNLLDTKRTADAPNFKASTKQGIIKVLYGYVPSEDLLASVSSVAAILQCFRELGPSANSDVLWDPPCKSRNRDGRSTQL